MKDALKDKGRAVFSVTNCICFDQRVQKMADAVKSLGYDILIIGRELGRCCKSDTVPFPTKRFKMIFNKNFPFYAFFNLRLFFYLLFHKSNILIANDLDTLLPNFLVSKIKKIPLVYDSHEYFKGVPEITGHPFVKWFWTALEKMIFPKLKHVITVSDSIAALYDNEYGIKPVVVRNMAPVSAAIPPYMREELGLGGDTLLAVLQGGGLNIERGTEELITAMSMVENVVLYIIGSGDVLPKLKKMVDCMHIAQKVRFFPKMKWQELMRYTKSADVGISVTKHVSINYEYSLPNKVFEYISAGIPVIVSDLLEVQKIVDDTGCGIVLHDITPESIAEALNTLKNNKNLYDKYKHNAIAASKRLTWENEVGKVLKIYSAL